MSDVTKVIAGVNKVVDIADALSARFARQLKQVIKDTERKLLPVIKDAASGNPTAIVRASLANATRIGLRDALQKAGFDTLAELATSAPLDTIAEHVLATRALAQQTAELSARASTKLQALQALQLSDLLDEGDQLGRALWQATIRGVFASRTVDAILSDLGNVLDHTEPQIRTLYDTAISIYGRQVEALQAGDSEETPFAYFGPADEKTRDFCLEHVGKVYTRAEIDQLDNGQLDNVFLTGGGYNCRHVWTEVSAFSELTDLGGARVPEIQSQLDVLDEAA